MFTVLIYRVVGSLVYRNATHIQNAYVNTNRVVGFPHVEKCYSHTEWLIYNYHTQ